MPNHKVEGKIVYTGTDCGIKGLEVVAFHLKLLFSEVILSSSFTDSDGNFEISYLHGRYRVWFPGRNSHLVVRVYTPGGRLLYETPKQRYVTAPILTIGTIEIHRTNIEGWLVTNATLDPTHPKLDSAGNPLSWTKGNRIDILKDGETLFPELTDAIKMANHFIHFTNMNFWLGEYLITKFPGKNDPEHPFDPLNPEIGTSVVGEKIHEILKARAPALSSTKIIVQDIPFIDQIPVISHLLRRFIGLDPDSVDEVKEFFQGSQVCVRSFSILSHSNFPSFMHAKAVIIDGVTAYVLGSTFSRSYFNGEDHLINDARHGGKLNHDVGIKLEGPVVQAIDGTFITLWNAANSSAPALLPPTGHASSELPGLGIQVVRTLPGNTFTSSHTGGAPIPCGETGVLEAYQRAIALATKYIYLEDQYFTAPEIFQAMVHRMSEVPGLEIIIVMNIEPDTSGYPEKQVQLLNRFRKDLIKKLGETQVNRRLGIFSLWSCNEKHPKYQVMPIYVHSKVAIVDDVWATIGSANLDGASLNQIQLDTIVQGNLAGLVKKGSLLKRVLLGLILTLTFPLVILTLLAAKIGWSRQSQHANPGQSRQPTRSTELNVVICEKDPDPAFPNTDVMKIREDLWREHLGEKSLPIPLNGWNKIWTDRAHEKQKNLQNDPLKPVGERRKHPAKILKWTPETDPEKYLRALDIPTLDMYIRSEADNFDFQTGQWEIE